MAKLILRFTLLSIAVALVPLWVYAQITDATRVDHAVGGNSVVLGNSTVGGNETVGGTLDVTGNFTMGSELTLGSAGVKISTDGDGAITFLGLGNGSDEDMTINLDDTSNTIAVSSSTSVSTLSLGSIGLSTTGTAATGALAVTGHVTSKGTVPTASAGTIDPKSTDHAGIVKTVGATSFYIMFASAYAAEPACVATAEEAVWITEKGTTSFSLAATGNIDSVSYACWELE